MAPRELRSHTSRLKQKKQWKQKLKVQPNRIVPQVLYHLQRTFGTNPDTCEYYTCQHLHKQQHYYPQQLKKLKQRKNFLTSATSTTSLLFSRAVLTALLFKWEWNFWWNLTISLTVWEIWENGAFWLAEMSGHMTWSEISWCMYTTALCTFVVFHGVLNTTRCVLSWCTVVCTVHNALCTFVVYCGVLYTMWCTGEYTTWCSGGYTTWCT